MDLKLDTLTGDLAMDGLDLVMTSDKEVITQRLLVRLRFFKGEWFLDTRAGVPWFQDILGKGRSLRSVESILKQQILATEGVNEIQSFSLEYDQAGRCLSVVFRVDTDAGELTISEVL